MLLEGKNAIIYGGGGAIGGAVACAFASERAKVFLAGRTPGSLEAVAEQIRSAGGVVETAQVDALKPRRERFTHACTPGGGKVGREHPHVASFQCLKVSSRRSLGENFAVAGG